MKNILGIVVLGLLLIRNAHAGDILSLPKHVVSGFKFFKSMNTYSQFKDYGAKIVNKIDGYPVRSGEKFLRFEITAGECYKNKSGWEIVSSPRRLHKEFEFNSHMHYSSFLNEILAYEAETGHYATLRCEYPSIVIEVYTHDVNAITEVDQDYARTANEIYEDVVNYSERNDYEF